MPKDKIEAEDLHVGESAIAKELAPQGSVIPEVARTPGGIPIVTAKSAYSGHYPVQFDNESDEGFLGRVAQFESSYANAVKNQPGGNALEVAKSALKARYAVDLKSLEAQFK